MTHDRVVWFLTFTRRGRVAIASRLDVAHLQRVLEARALSSPRSEAQAR